MEKEESAEKKVANPPVFEGTLALHADVQGESSEIIKLGSIRENSDKGDELNDFKGKNEIFKSEAVESEIPEEPSNWSNNLEVTTQTLKELNVKGTSEMDESEGVESRSPNELGNGSNSPKVTIEILEELNDLKGTTEVNKSEELEPESPEEPSNKSDRPEVTTQTLEEVLCEEEEDPVFDGTEVPGMEANRSSSTHYLDVNSEMQGSVWPEKAAALKNFVKEKGAVAVSNVFRRLSGRKDDDGLNVSEDGVRNDHDESSVDVADPAKETLAKDDSHKAAERFKWNPLSFVMVSRDPDAVNNNGMMEEAIEEATLPIAMKGRILLYTRLGCQDCNAARLFLHWKRLRYVEINIDVYPGRKVELEKISGSNAVPKIFFNEILVGGFSELKDLDESGRLDEKINYLITEVPSMEGPLPPLSGEDDLSSSGAVDELAVVVHKMKKSVTVKDRYYKIRRFTDCFIGSEAVDFLSEDQYLEREEAIEFGRKLASKLFFTHVLDENIFEDGSHLYRFLDDDPVLSQCYNIPRGILDVKPKPIVEIASRLRFLCYATYEAYTSDGGKHIDYRSIHGSEEFARYLRTVEELQRVDLEKMPREEKLAFFINLYNMMAIHAILVLGHPAGAMERRKLLGDFKYVIGGCTYSLSAIHNGILRSNQRPPYNLTKPFGIKDRRSTVALPYLEPLVHFALVCGNRSEPALRCYSPGDIDKELVDAACGFLTSGGLIIDFNFNAASVSKILKWYSVDFGRNETEVLKHAANYLEAAESEVFLELIAGAQLKVTYQPFDWSLNC